jgi:hypothetical protein
MRECSDVLALVTHQSSTERGPSLQPVKDINP